MIGPSQRNQWLVAEEAVLLSDCAVDLHRTGGPGGQHRNKASTAVRLRHRPTGLVVIAEESRSQHENKLRAVRRLRMAIALECRVAVDDHWQLPAIFMARSGAVGRVEISRRNPAYPLVVAAALDAVAAKEGRLREAAALLRLNTSQLSRLLTADGKLLAAANRIRQAAGLHAIS
jgi:hypothetical protein